MAEIVEVSDLEAWLGISLTDGSAEEAAAQRLLDGTEETLEGEANVTFRAQAGMVADEPHSGGWTRSVKVKYPVDDLRATGSELKIGVDPASPQQTVDLTDPVQAALDPHIRRRIHLHSVTLPGRREGNVHVTYRAAALAPAAAVQGILEVAAAAWQKKGAEGLQRASIGRLLTVELADARAKSEHWQRAVDDLLNPTLG